MAAVWRRGPGLGRPGDPAGLGAGGDLHGGGQVEGGSVDDGLGAHVLGAGGVGDAEAGAPPVGVEAAPDVLQVVVGQEPGVGGVHEGAGQAPVPVLVEGVHVEVAGLLQVGGSA